MIGLPVHFLGKAATFCLLYAFPLLLLGDGATRPGSTPRRRPRRRLGVRDLGHRPVLVGRAALHRAGATHPAASADAGTARPGRLDGAADRAGQGRRRARSTPRPRVGTAAPGRPGPRGWRSSSPCAAVAGVLALAVVQRQAVAPEAEQARQVLVDRVARTQEEIAEPSRRTSPQTRADLAAAAGGAPRAVRRGRGARRADRLARGRRPATPPSRARGWSSSSTRRTAPTRPRPTTRAASSTPTCRTP